MITENCLVGCKVGKHHKYCNNQPNVEVKYYLSEVENEIAYEFKPFTPLTKKEVIENRLKLIVEKFSLNVKNYNKKKVIEKYYFMNYLHKQLHFTFEQIRSLMELKNIDNVKYGLNRLTELKEDRNYLYRTNKLRKELKLLINYENN